MDAELRKFLASCHAIDFGRVNLTPDEKNLLKELNQELIRLCRSLPPSAQTGAILFFMRRSGASIGEELDFFKKFYPPTWSVMRWIVQSGQSRKTVPQEKLRSARTAHAMAMFLHYLDDHLHDRDLPVTHLALLVRSQSWLMMRRALDHVADGIDGGASIIGGFLDDYYSAILDPTDMNSLDDYCDRFRRQMATGLIVPDLLCLMMGADDRFRQAAQSAYCSFGVAWRLLDDLNDLETDLLNGARSALYFSLTDEVKPLWDSTRYAGQYGEQFERVIRRIQEQGVSDLLIEKIRAELASGAAHAESCGMTGLAHEFHELSRPLKPAQDWAL